MTTIFRRIGLILVGALAGASANAFNAKLEHLQPTGTALVTDDIPVWVRFTLDEDFDFSVDSTYPYGLGSGQIAAANADAEMWDGVKLSATTKLSYAALGVPYSFANVPNHFLFDYEMIGQSYLDGAWPGSLQSDHLHLDAGTYDFLATTFRPKGAVVPGTYNAGMFSLSILAIATDIVTGQSSFIEIPLASTCEKVSTCAFTRTVTAVPESASLAYLGIGLLGLLTWRRSAKRLGVPHSN